MTEFWILRCFTSCPFVTNSTNAVYEKYYPPLVTSGRGKDGAHTKTISAKEAKRLIAERGMTKVLENKYGDIWRCV